MGFHVDKPILWAGSAISAAATGTNNFLSFPSCTLRNNAGSSWTATQYATLYLAGTLAGNVFTVASENWLTTAPANESLTYISLGYMYSTYQMYFYPEHPMFRLVNGILTAISQIAYEAQVAADSAQATAEAVQTDFKRVVRIDDDGLHVGDNLSNGEVLSTANRSTWYSVVRSTRSSRAVMSSLATTSFVVPLTVGWYSNLREEV